MAPWQTGTVEANGVSLFYTRSGGKLPPLLLAHGFSDDGPCWTPIAEGQASRGGVGLRRIHAAGGVRRGDDRVDHATPESRYAFR